MQFTTRVPDPVWGAIPITELERRMLEHWSLRRLAQIKQMGLAFLDYPGLTHTRLEHSIGVMHVADAIFGILYANTADDGGLRDVFEKRGQDRVRQAVRLAALLHDLGHPPFSHAVETVFQKYPALLAKAGKGLGRKDQDLRPVFRKYSHEAFSEHAIGSLLKEEGLRDHLSEAIGERLLPTSPDWRWARHGISSPRSTRSSAATSMPTASTT